VSTIRSDTHSASSPAADGTHWARRLARQWWHLPVLKGVGICSFLTLFFVAYFHLLRHPASPPFTMPLTLLDGWIPFQPLALWPYVSLWLYVGIPPALQTSVRNLLLYGLWVGSLSLTGLLCFYLWPTAVPPLMQQIDPELTREGGMALLRGMDAAGNACPSMHVASAVFSAAWTRRMLAQAGAPGWTQAVNAVWLLLICWSTVAIRQHVVLDVLAGALLGALFAAASLRATAPRGPGMAGQPL
jgi:membrane-associated phospholipid phosphatase